ncbi:MAG: OB-fold domain-containing protein [Chloroflexi bacterium]|nr:OB-fold domain-containing protein [Chloroflexota bacterium]
MPGNEKAQKKQVPIKEGFFTMPLSPLENVRLNGSKCRKCGEVFLGKAIGCENCGSADMEELPLSKRGKLYTYTVIEHRPPGDYKGPDPFVPFGEGFVELPEGLRIVAPLTESKNLKIGMDLELVVHKLFEDANGNEVIAYKFKPV